VTVQEVAVHICGAKAPVVRLTVTPRGPPLWVVPRPGDAGHGAIPISFVVDAEVVVATQGVCQTLRRIPAVCGTVAKANVEAWIIHTK